MKKCILISIFVLISCSCFGETYYGKRIGIETGLSQACVTCVQYDNKGSLWIGTRFGLNEYRDGKVNTWLRTYVNNIFCDSIENIWVTTNQGVLKYDSSKNSFVQIIHTPANTIFEKDGLLYIGGHEGIIKYDLESGQVWGGESEVWTDILKISSFDDSIICIDRRIGISVHNETGQFKLDIAELEGATIMSASQIGSRLYLCILGKGVLIYDLQAKSVIKFIKQGTKGLGPDLILSSAVINGKVWLGTDGNGILIMNPQSGEVTGFYDSITLNPGTEVPSSVTCIYSDPVENIWIGGVYFGVTGLKKTSIGSYLPKNIINRLYCSCDKKLYVCTDGDGIYSRDPQTGLLSWFESTKGLKITSIADFDSQNMIFSAYNIGFFFLNKSTGKIKRMILVDKETDQAETRYGNSPELCKLSDGKILIFAVNNYIFDPSTKEISMLKDQTNGRARDLHTIYGKGHDNYTYSHYSIYKIDSGKECLNQFYYSEYGTVNSVVCTDSTIIFGTDKGLYELDLATIKVRQLETGLFTRVTNLCRSEDGNVWVGADNNIFIYKNGIFTMVGEQNGVAANEINCSVYSSEGEVFLGGSSGFLSINTGKSLASDKEDQKTFKVKSVTLHERSIAPKNGKYVLPHDFESFNLSISTYGADPMEKTYYKYDVVGNNSFSLPSYESSIVIPKLIAGNYTINVSCLLSQGKWSEAQEIAKIMVLRPWYLSIVMLVVYLMIFVAGLIGFAEYINRQTVLRMKVQLAQKDAEFISKFENYIMEHLSDNNLNVKDIAADLAMSRATLYKKVNSCYTVGIGEYIEEKRIEKSKDLLSSTKLSIAEIAENTGYSTPRYFSTRFKAITGQSPLEYRKNHH